MKTRNKNSKTTKNVFSKERLFLISSVVFIVLAVVALAVFYAAPRIVATAREKQILSVYSSINLGDDYILQSENIFGEKRIYSWDKSRSHSSSRDYIRGKNVDETIKDLQNHVEAAGFTQIDHPYPHQWQYKSKDDVYVRFNVLSKPRMDYFQNLNVMGKDFTTAKYDDFNTGPSNITLKVNLDDNNE